MSLYKKEDIIRMVEKEDVEFVRLQFTDLFGNLKNIAITSSQLEKALNNKCIFDASSISGFIRIEEADMYLYPDLDTFAIFPWRPQQGKVARLLCDVYTTKRVPFEGDPRYILKKQIEKISQQGYGFDVGPECEFFLFHTDDDGMPTTLTHEKGGYFDVSPIDLGENVRRDIILTLEDLGFDVESSHHEMARSQHEVDFRYDDALTTADNIMTFELVVKTIAKRNGLHATFMPKPVYGQNGSGMHTNMSLTKDGKNVFDDPTDPLGLSKEGYYFIGGIFKHIDAITALANPNVNSYKRLVPGYEAPVYETWSTKSRCAMLRIPEERESGICIELCSPDPSCNPYLTLAVCLAAGMDGIENQIMPPERVDENVFELTSKERAERGIGRLPKTLKEALDALEKDELLMKVLGENTGKKYIRAKREEWAQYSEQVTQWEINQYLHRL